MQKRMTFYISISATIICFGLGVLGSFGYFEKIGAAPNIAIYLAIMLVCFIAFLAILILTYFYRMFDIKIKSRILYEDIFDVKHCSDNDVIKIAYIASDIFGDRATSVDQAIRLHNIDGNAFKYIEDQCGNLRAYYCLIRLTKAGAKAIERDDFNISTVPIEYIRRDSAYRNAYYYIGAIYGDSRQSKDFVAGTLNGRLSEVRPKKVFARAATEDGLKILKKRGFKPVNGRDPGLDMLFALSKK